MVSFVSMEVLLMNTFIDDLMPLVYVICFFLCIYLISIQFSKSKLDIV